MATARDSAWYANAFTNKLPGLNAQKVRTKVIELPFQVTVASPFAQNDTYNLTVIPANAEVLGLTCTSNGLGASAGVTINVKIGDSGQDDRYMASTNLGAATTNGTINYRGMNYVPSADTVAVLKITSTGAVVGQVLNGTIKVALAL